MWRSRIHLMVNLLLALAALSLCLLVVWRSLDTFWLRLLLTIIFVAAAPVVAHRLAPRLTGSAVEWVCERLGI